jgi:hypothetical protein
MVDRLEYMQRRARELARSGKFASWRAVAFELQFEPTLREVFWSYSSAGEAALKWLHHPATKAEIDELCFEATHGPIHPEAA